MDEFFNGRWIGLIPKNCDTREAVDSGTLGDRKDAALRHRKRMTGRIWSMRGIRQQEKR